MAIILARHPKTGIVVEFVVDDEDAELVSGFRWRIDISGYPTITRYRDGLRRSIQVARLLLNPPDSETYVDHIDGDPLNNSRSNLRLSTNSQNQANRRRLPKNTSGYRGVTWHRQAGKWQAGIKVMGRSHHLGLHDSAESAANAYMAAAKRLFGEFATPEAKVPASNA